MTSSRNEGARFVTVARASAGLGVALIAGAVVAGALGQRGFFRGYLLALVFWTQVAVGSLGVLMLQYLTGGAWGRAVRRLLEAATRTLPLLALLFVPIALGLGDLYEWAHPDLQDPLLARKAGFLNVPFFLARAAGYWLVWLGAAALLNRWSEGRSRPRGEGEAQAGGRLKALSSVGLVAWTLTVTFSSIDWVMSLEPHWASTMFPLLFIAGEVLTAFAFAIALAALLGVAPGTQGGRAYHDLGKLLLAFVMLWAYVAFSQYLIVWSGNLPEEIPWYLRRLAAGWRGVGVAIVVAHFALPFALLLPRAANRDRRLLGATALLLLVMRFVETLWTIVPASGSPGAASLHWMDLGLPVGVGGLWIALFLRELGRGRGGLDLDASSQP
ncbi:MAG: hypothetical protein HYY06_25930 [Deltaproteobacteria bacterium]|nr:hypothetical protein [Deltaproteobacteria bacterium]